ncbi:MAG: terminase family protein, partial [Hyphomonadaceae bacterium]
MKRPYAQSCDAASLASLTPSARELLWKHWSASALAELGADWWVWSRPSQRPPECDWRDWLFLGGRGAGKTRAGSEWVSFLARTGAAKRIALVGPTFHDVREVMIEGASGLRALPHRDRPAYEPSRRRLIWPNGAQAFGFSAEDVDGMRGPQFDAAWCDELCHWKSPGAALQVLAHALRMGETPLMLVTSTPKPSAALKMLLADSGTAVTRASTFENRANLAPGFIASLEERWSGSAHERQELLGELLEDHEGALWTRALIEAARTGAWRQPDRVIVVVDPPAGVGKGANACGIIAAGRFEVNGQSR